MNDVLVPSVCPLGFGMVLDTKTLGLLNPSLSVPSAYLRTANPEVLSLLVLENLLHTVPPFLFTLLS